MIPWRLSLETVRKVSELRRELRGPMGSRKEAIPGVLKREEVKRSRA